MPLGSHWVALAEDLALLASLGTGAAPESGATPLPGELRRRSFPGRHPEPGPARNSGLRALRALLPRGAGENSAALRRRRGTLPLRGHSGPGGAPPAPSPLPPTVVQRHRGSPPQAPGTAADGPARGPAFGADYLRRQGPRQALAAFYQGKERQRARDDLPAYDETSLDRALRSQDSRGGALPRARAPEPFGDYRLAPAPARGNPRPRLPGTFAAGGAVTLAAADYRHSGAASYVAREEALRWLRRLGAEGPLSPGGWH